MNKNVEANLVGTSNYYSSINPNTVKQQGTTAASSASCAANSTITTTTTGPQSWSGTTSTYPYYSYDTDASISLDNWEEIIADNWTMKFNDSDEFLEKIVKKIFDNEGDLVPIVKNYLTKYLEKVMDNPDDVVDSVIKDIIEKKNEEIERLNGKIINLNRLINELTKKLSEVSQKLNRLEQVDNNPWGSNISWYASTAISSAETLSSLSKNTTSTKA